MSNVVAKEEILNVLNDAIYQHDLRMIAKLIRLSEVQQILYAYLDDMGLTINDWEQISLLAQDVDDMVLTINDWEQISLLAQDVDDDNYSSYTALAFAYILAQEQNAVSQEKLEDFREEMKMFREDTKYGYNDVMEIALWMNNGSRFQEMLKTQGKDLACLYIVKMMKQQGASSQQQNDFYFNRDITVLNNYQVPKFFVKHL